MNSTKTYPKVLNCRQVILILLILCLRKPPVIVKFLRRTLRNEVYAKKRALKGKGMVITESLTRRRLQLVEAAREAFAWSSVWTFKGDVYSLVKGKKQMIRHINDIAQMRSMANSR